MKKNIKIENKAALTSTNIHRLFKKKNINIEKKNTLFNHYI